MREVHHDLTCTPYGHGVDSLGIDKSDDSLDKSDDLYNILLFLFDETDVEETRENLEQGRENHIHGTLRDGFEVCQSVILPSVLSEEAGTPTLVAVSTVSTVSTKLAARNKYEVWRGDSSHRIEVCD